MTGALTDPSRNGKRRTLAIQHIRSVTWVDQFMLLPGILRIPLLFAISGAVLLIPAQLGVPLDESLAALVSVVMTGAILAVLVILAQGAESDLREEGAEAYLTGLSPSRRAAMTEHAIALVFGFTSLSYFNSVFSTWPGEWLQLLDPSYYQTAPVGRLLNDWLISITVVFSGMLIVHAVGICRRQIRVFSQWARDIEIDLMHTEDCQVFTLQPLRYLLITVLFISLNIIAYEVLSNIGQGEAAIFGLLPFVLCMMAAVVPIARPVNIVRHRIAAAKQQEISAVRAAVRGDRSALAESQIASFADEFQAPDLMMYEQYVRTIWEWPIQGYVQRILLYVLLPPVAWILAALVEQLVDSALQ